MPECTVCGCAGRTPTVASSQQERKQREIALEFLQEARSEAQEARLRAENLPLNFVLWVSTPKNKPSKSMTNKTPTFLFVILWYGFCKLYVAFFIHPDGRAAVEGVLTQYAHCFL